jgi:hypothetical protein
MIKQVGVVTQQERVWFTGVLLSLIYYGQSLAAFMLNWVNGVCARSQAVWLWLHSMHGLHLI